VRFSSETQAAIEDLNIIEKGNLDERQHTVLVGVDFQ